MKELPCQRLCRLNTRWPRRVFSARWVGDDAVYAKRAGRTSPPFPGLTLADGAPLDDPLFPVVYP